jgi:hypothetical protein
MTRTTAATAAFVICYFGTLLVAARAGRGDSTDPNHVALQTRQDTGSIYACLVITNSLLAAILAALIF